MYQINPYTCNVIESQKTPIANFSLKFIQAIRLMNCSLSRTFWLSATRSQRICLLLKSEQVEQIQRFTQKRTVKHALLSKLTEGATSTLTTFDFVVGWKTTIFANGCLTAQKDVGENEWLDQVNGLKIKPDESLPTKDIKGTMLKT